MHLTWCKQRSILSNHERTYTVDRVAPIFNYFADSIGSIQFEWFVFSYLILCSANLSMLYRWEKLIASRKNTSFSSSTNSTSTANFAVDTGFLDDERIIFEASSGGMDEDSSHIYGDSLKLIETMTSVPLTKAAQ